jgi:hypothetical protein
VASTEWIASIDSDVLVYANWWDVMSKHIADDVGMIRSFMEGSIRRVVPSYDAFTKWMVIRKFPKDKITTTMANNLLRRTLLLSCEGKLAHVHAGEDAIIGKHVVDSGYKCVIDTRITALHYHKDPISHYKMACYRGGESDVMYNGKLRGSLIFLQSLLSSLRYLTIYSYYTKTVDPQLYSFEMLGFIERVKGAIGKIKEM